MDNIKLSAFQDMCRSCMSPFDLIFINDNILINILQLLSGAKYSKSDELPQKLCLKCIKTMNDINSFALICQQTHLSLTKYLFDSKNNQSALFQNETICTVYNKSEINPESFDHKIEINLEESEFVCIKQEIIEDVVLTPKVDDRRYVCDICSKRFKQSSHLTDHKRIHSGERPFQCDLCKKRFSLKHNLVTHQAVHSAERQFECDVCFKRFKHPRQLKEHKGLHNIQQLYQCDLCMKSFTQKSYLVKHKRTHTDERPYKCDVCDKTFSLKRHLVKHKATHSDKRRFKCDLCMKNFKQSAHLIRHKRTHSGERPFLCNFCDKSFPDQSALIKHKATHAFEFS